MLRIRLRRAGKKNYAQYRIVVTDSRNPIHGKFISRLGHYNPHTKEVVINSAELLEWLGKGAQPSNSVAKLLEKSKIKHPSIKVVQRPPRKAKKKEESMPPTPQKEEQPAEEVKEEKTAEPDKVEEIVAENKSEEVIEKKADQVVEI